MRTAPSLQRGVAIIMVLLIVALATTLVSYLAVQQNAWQRQVSNQLDRAQARRIGIAGVDWARAILADDAHASSIDHDKEIWAKRLPAMPIDNGEVTGQIEDRQGLFNLNNLVRDGAASEADIASLRRLLATLSLSEDLVDALVDWLDNDSEMRFPAGAEDVYYLALARPYRTANRYLTELNELILVRGFDQKIIDRLRPFVSTLPEPTTLNVNFASAEVLSAVITGLSLSEARTIVQQRNTEPYKDIADFAKRMPNPKLQLIQGALSVNSQYFWVTGRAKIGQAQVTTQTLLQRAGDWPVVIWQTVL